jgi:hypothetical protein
MTESERIDVIDVKERIVIGQSLTSSQRDFVLDCINEATKPQFEIEHNPPNYLGRIEHLWAFLSLDDGGEGVCAGPLGAFPVVPYIAADKARLDSLRPLAREIAKRFGKPVRLAKFTKREDVEIIQP